MAKGLNNPRCEFGLKLNIAGFNTEFYQKPIQYSVGLCKRKSRRKRKKKVTFSTGNLANTDSNNSHKIPITSARDKSKYFDNK